MLTPTAKKQEISYLHLHAIATHLGYSVERPIIDSDSVDATVCAKGRVEGSNGKLSSPKIDIQLKATEGDPDDELISFALHKKNYDELRQKTMVPRILVVLYLPKEKDWVNFDLEKIELYGKGYWMSLKGREEVQNQYNVTIHLPQSQRFTVSALHQLMIAAANREEFAYGSC